MKQKIYSALRILFFLALGIGLFWFVLRNQNISDVKNSLLHANWWWAIVSLLFALASNVFRSIRWNMLIHPLNYKPKFANTFCAVMVGYLANLVVTRMGEVTRCALMNQYEKIPMSSLIGTVVVERVVDFITLFICLLLIIVLEFDKMSAISNENIFIPLGNKIQSLVGKGFSFYLVVAAIILGLGLIFYFLYRRRNKFKFYLKLTDLAKGFVSGLKTIGQLKEKKMFIVHSVLIWICYFMMSYVCFNSFPGTTGLGFSAGLAVLVFGAFGFVAPVPGGIGAFEFMVTTALATYAVDKDTQSAYAILTHFSQTGAVLVFGSLSLVILAVINKPKKA